MRRVVLILLALVVLVPSSSWASALYRCGHDGEVRSACCCPAKTKHHDKNRGADAQIKPACCCKITTIEARESSVRSAPPVALDVAPAIVPVVIAIAVTVTPVRVARLDREPAQRGPPEPLFVRHCSFLL